MRRGLLCLPLLAPLACGDLPGDTDAATLGTSDATTSTDTSTAGSTNPTTTQTPPDTSEGSMSGAETTTTGAPTSTSEPLTSTTTGDPPKADMGSSGGEFLRCHDAPPDGATLAPDIPAYGGSCPTLEIGYMEGQAFNVLPQQLGNNTVERQFLVIAPEDAAPDERLPVIFLWHWLGGDAQDFYERGDVQNAVNQKRFIAVIPEAREGLLFKWPFSAIDSDADLQAEFQFFDDMLSCVAEQFSVNKECVSSTGVSAGALFTSQLAGGRGDVLSSFMSLSGGTGGAIKPWTAPAHKMPAMVLWGGPDDFCILIDFEQTFEGPRAEPRGRRSLRPRVRPQLQPLDAAVPGRAGRDRLRAAVGFFPGSPVLAGAGRVALQRVRHPGRHARLVRDRGRQRGPAARAVRQERVLVTITPRTQKGPARCDRALGAPSWRFGLTAR
ncbi:hypothetical protein [Nannocystis pusilla]|uniref:hypothetical protein n=1 Tax=Nannocystis pusilla TaxID=889268 RepID=UPI003DA37108